MKRNKHKHKLVAEINVVPYIDVTLVLMVIFMITAPLLMQGVKVELPVANSAPIESEERDPFIVSVKDDGTYWVDEKGINQPKSLSLVKDRVAKILRQQPETPILVWGDKGVDYGAVVNLMSELQRAGASSVGLVTEPPSR
ncbi:protein TolR [Porticoccaceae bacterium]|nr:protein TolR [Porticoccaceae bacterium]MDA8651292.1 protein TolR [Porticoccaceae bacterium]MDA8682538.1 protein TolR [Porticoccaceae bacterium]MDB2343580.1 protein TolR [Porticoccaceae bacterium]